MSTFAPPTLVPESEYRAVFEVVNDALLIFDFEGQLLDCNPAAQHLFGYTRAEFRAVPAQQLVPPTFTEQFLRFGDTIRAGREFRARGQLQRHDGTLFAAEVRGAPFTYQDRPHALAIIRDISDEVAATELLEQRVEARTRELTTLLSVSQAMVSTLELSPLLELILDQLRAIVAYQMVGLSMLDRDDLVVLAARGTEGEVGTRSPLAEHANTREMLRVGQPTMAPDIHADTPLARRLRHNIAALPPAQQTAYADIRSWMSVPLIAHDARVGVLTLAYQEPNYYTPARAALVLAFANQAAIAIQNARLYQQAQQLAALEERQKLARELHDSVSQALYGIALGARTARAQLERDVSQVAEPLDYVLSLAEAGLAEMRALIFELRPESLQTEGLVAALTKLAEALRVRHRLAVKTELMAEPNLALEAKEALYRIAQEALHNIAKHAQASQVQVRLQLHAQHVQLEIQDNGVGFDPQATYPGHLGLQSMRERVERLGGHFELTSAVGQGTRVVVQLAISVG